MSTSLRRPAASAAPSARRSAGASTPNGTMPSASSPPTITRGVGAEARNACSKWVLPMPGGPTTSITEPRPARCAASASSSVASSARRPTSAEVVPGLRSAAARPVIAAARTG